MKAIRRRGAHGAGAPAALVLAMLAGVPAFAAGTPAPDALVDPMLDPFADRLDPLAALDNGRDANSCIILIGSAGVIEASLDMQNLSSEVMGGRAATATVQASNGSFRLVYDAPQGFLTQPSGPVPPVTFSGTLRANGATQVDGLGVGRPVKLKRGTTQVELSLTASAHGNTFPAGQFATETTLRCE